MTIDLNYWYLYLYNYWYLFGLTALVVIVFGGCWWLWWFFPKKQAYRLGLILGDAKARADVEDNFRKTIGQLFGGIALLIGTWFAYIQFSQQHQASHALLISNQVSKGFEQLGSHEIMVRLGGIYALEGVMNTSDQYHVPVLEALCAFVRDGTAAKDVTKPPATQEPPATDIQAALTVIGRRAAGVGQVNLGLVNIPEAELNGADLRGANLRRAYLRGANLRYVYLSDANLGYADLRGANLRGADLSGAYLRDSDLRDAYLGGANLRDADLRDANLDRADLSDANLSGAHLDGAHLSYADLREANLSGVVGLSQTQLSSACGVNAILPSGLTLEPCGSR